LYIAKCEKCINVSKIKNFSFQLEEGTTTDLQDPMSSMQGIAVSVLSGKRRGKLAHNCRGIHLLAAFPEWIVFSVVVNSLVDLQAGHSGDQAQWSQNSKGSQSLNYKIIFQFIFM
jgi:hypothetical protein